MTYTAEQEKIFEEWKNGNLPRVMADKLLGKEILIEMSQRPPPAQPPVAVRPWDEFYLTIVKVPSSPKNQRKRWALYGVVFDNGKVIYSWMTDPANKSMTIGKFKTAGETIFGEFDLLRGGHPEQLHAATVSTLVNDQVLLYGPVFTAPWLRINRKPEYSMHIGAKAIIKRIGEKVGIIDFDHKDEVKIAGQKRGYVIEEYARLVGWIGSVDESPIFEPAHNEWKTIISKRFKQ